MNGAGFSSETDFGGQLAGGRCDFHHRWVSVGSLYLPSIEQLDWIKVLNAIRPKSVKGLILMQTIAQLYE